MSYCIGTNSAKHTFRGAMQIIKSFGIQVKCCKSSEIDNCKGLSWAVQKDGRPEYYILLADDLPLEEIRLTLAHEMSHLILGHLIGEFTDKKYNISLEQQEFEAEALGLILYNFWYGIKCDRGACND